MRGHQLLPKVIILQHQLPLAIREANQKDINYVIHSWMKNIEHSPMAWYCDYQEWAFQYRQLLYQVIERSTIIIAYNPEDPSHIFGFLVFEPDPLYLHFIYTKGAFRQMQVAIRLLSTLITTDQKVPCSHVGKDKDFPHLKHHFPNLYYSPFKLWSQFTC